MSVILVEHLLPSEAKLITESVDGKEPRYLRGIIMQSTITNRNGRIYPLTEIQKAVAKMQAEIKESKVILGLMEHPEGLHGPLDRVSHGIIEVGMSGNDAVGRIELAETPMGSIAKGIIKLGAKLGISSRGAGELVENVVHNYDVISADLVAMPSAQQAYMSLSESVDTKAGKPVLSLAQHVRHDPAAQKYFDREIKKFVESLFN